MIKCEIKSGRTFSPRFLDGLNYWDALAHKKSTPGSIIFAGSSHQPRTHKTLVSWQSIDDLFKTT